MTRLNLQHFLQRQRAHPVLMPLSRLFPFPDHMPWPHTFPTVFYCLSVFVPVWDSSPSLSPFFSCTIHITSSNGSISSIRVKIHMPYFLIQVSSQPSSQSPHLLILPRLPPTSIWSTSLRAGTWLSSQEHSTSTCWNEKEWNWTNWKGESQGRWPITQCPTWKHKPLLRDRPLESESEWMESVALVNQWGLLPAPPSGNGLNSITTSGQDYVELPCGFLYRFSIQSKGTSPTTQMPHSPRQKSCWHTPQCHGLGLDV